MTIALQPVGAVEGGRIAPTRDGWGDNRCWLALDPALFGPDALRGLDEVSHVVVVFYFHLETDERAETGAFRPRGRADWPEVGIFAQRGRMRPNRIGVTTCEVVRVEGASVEVRGLDAVHGTPILDIKPVWSGFNPRGEVREPDWARELMSSYW